MKSVKSENVGKLRKNGKRQFGSRESDSPFEECDSDEGKRVVCHFLFKPRETDSTVHIMTSEKVSTFDPELFRNSLQMWLQQHRPAEQASLMS